MVYYAMCGQGGDWKLGGFEMTAEITSDGPAYIYTAFESFSDANYKSPGARSASCVAVWAS